MTTYAVALRHHVERSLRKDFGLPPLHPDADGDYAVAGEGGVVWTRVALGHEPPLVRVWAPAADGVKKSLALFAEINELNIGLGQVRCTWFERTVLVSAEVEIESVQPGQLGRLVAHVGATARHVGELIATVHGGVAVAVSADADQEPADRSDQP